MLFLVFCLSSDMVWVSADLSVEPEVMVEQGPPRGNGTGSRGETQAGGEKYMSTGSTARAESVFPPHVEDLAKEAGSGIL